MVRLRQMCVALRGVVNSVTATQPMLAPSEQDVCSSQGTHTLHTRYIYILTIARQHANQASDG